MPVQIKICGINSPAAMAALLKAGVDFAGLTFFAKSPRFVSAGQADMLARQSGSGIRRVGLFVDADDGMISDAVEAARLDVLQLHGEETPQRAAALRARYGLPVWKVVSVRGTDDIAAARKWQGAADLILFDAKTPSNAELPGGMGVRFDWSLLAGFRSALPWGLAGGLSPDNVAQAIAMTGAPLVDVASGVESAPGVKDVDKIAAFCQAVRDCSP